MTSGPVIVSLLVDIAAVVGIATAAAAAVVVGKDRLRLTYTNFGQRVRETVPYLVLLGAIVIVTRTLRTMSTELSWTIGWNITGPIYDVEREFVALIQTVASPPLTGVFSFLYVYGYVFLLVFPLVAYFALDDNGPFKQLTVAYVTNYVIGVVLYTFIIAYGPRNVLPGQVEPLLYIAHPEFHVLTSQINTNTNVFPSLHSSLSVTVAAFAWATREYYPRWVPITIVLTLGVLISTIYLGIHWGVDVIAGMFVGLVCVRFSRWAVSRMG